MEHSGNPCGNTAMLLNRDNQVHNPEGSRRFNGATGRPNITPDRFDGKTPWKDYRCHFEACKLANGWDDNQAAIFLAASLKGLALKVLGCCDIVEGQSKLQYRGLLKSLDAQFGPGQMAENY